MMFGQNKGLDWMSAKKSIVVFHSCKVSMEWLVLQRGWNQLSHNDPIHFDRQQADSSCCPNDHGTMAFTIDGHIID
jgi:hypothetical protein